MLASYVMRNSLVSTAKILYLNLRRTSGGGYLSLFVSKHHLLKLYRIPCEQCFAGIGALYGMFIF